MSIGLFGDFIDVIMEKLEFRMLDVSIEVVDFNSCLLRGWMCDLSVWVLF